jgi:tetratricopeptide (TPR) repeat protein
MQELEAFRTGSRVDLAQGEQAFQRGNYPAATAAFQRAVDRDPDDLEARLNLGSALLKSERTDEAIAQYEEVLRQDPANPTANFDLGVTMAQQGDEAGAIAYYRKALEADPLYRGPRFNLANSLRRSGDCEQARTHYRSLIEANPGDGSARLGEAVCLVEERQYAAARQRFKEALQALPKSRSLANAGARLLAAAPDDSVRDGEQALGIASQLMQLEQRPEHTETLAMALAETGRFEEAIEHQTKLLEGAESAKRERVIPRLRANLERYQRGEACRDPAIGEF